MAEARKWNPKPRSYAERTEGTVYPRSDWYRPWESQYSMPVGGRGVTAGGRGVIGGPIGNYSPSYAMVNEILRGVKIDPSTLTEDQQKQLQMIYSNENIKGPRDAMFAVYSIINPDITLRDFNFAYSRAFQPAALGGGAKNANMGSLFQLVNPTKGGGGTTEDLGIQQMPSWSGWSPLPIVNQRY